MKKNLLIIFVLLYWYGGYSQGVSSWYITLNGSTKIYGASPGTNVDVGVGVSYLMTGHITLSSGATTDTNFYIRFTNDVGTNNDILLGTVRQPASYLDFSLIWPGNNYGTTTGAVMQVSIVYTSTINNVYTTGQTNTYIAFKPRTKLAVTGATIAIPCGTSTTLNAVASGGVPPYTYKWSSSSPLSSTTISNPVTSYGGTYTITVTDSSWPVQGTYNYFVVSVLPLAAPTIVGSSIFYLPCANSTATYTYSISNLPAGVTGVNWAVLNFPNSTVSYNYTGSVATGINVSFGNGIQVASLINSQASGTPPPSNQFQITCSYFNAKCTSTTTTLTITESLRSCAPGPVPIAALSVSPNPTVDGNATIHYSVTNPNQVRLVIVDSAGNSIFSKNLGYLEAGNYSESVSLSQKGILIVRLISGAETQTQRIIAQ